MDINNRCRIKLFGLFVLQLCSMSLNAGWCWYQPAPIVVCRQPSAGEAIATGVVAVGACIGLGIAAIVERRAKKRRFKEYIENFRDMGYTKEQARIYAQMAMENPEGLQAVVRSIDQEKLVQTQILAQHELMKKSHDQNLQDKKELHNQKLEQMSHEHKLRLLTYLVMLLTTIILLGGGFLLYRKR